MATTPSKMKERITFQSFTRISDGGGGWTETWSNIATHPTVWAQLVAKAGKEAMVADRLVATAVTLFHIRNRDDLDETMRILWRGRAYNIRGIRFEGHAEQYLTIEAERGVTS